MEEPYRSFRIGVTVKEDPKGKIEKIPLNIGKEGQKPTLENKEHESRMDQTTKVFLPNVKPEPNSEHKKEKVLDVQSFVFETTISDEKHSTSTKRYQTIQEKVTIVKNSEPKNGPRRELDYIALMELVPWVENLLGFIQSCERKVVFLIF